MAKFALMKADESLPVMIVFDDSNIQLIESLFDESVAEGYTFVKRTLDEWNSGQNRFSRSGEQLWGLFSEGQLTGIGGLNQDTYVDDEMTGRVRHLYIRQASRRQKQATRLLNKITEEAAKHFKRIRLFTDNPEAAMFYEAFGFRRVDSHKVTHELTFSHRMQ